MEKQKILDQIKGGLIVSCQALEHEPLYMKEGGIMPLMAKAAAQSGAVGIRANTVRDITQIKEVVALPVIGIIKKDYEGTPMYITVTMKEVDALLGNIGETAPSSPKSGDFWYKVDHTAQSVVLMKYDGAEWKNATEKQTLTYTWYMQDKDGKAITFEKSGKVIYLSAKDIDSLVTLQCDVSKG